VGSLDTNEAFLVRSEPTVTAQLIVGMTKFKDKEAVLIVLRKENPAVPVFESLIKPLSPVTFRFHPQDVIWVCLPGEGMTKECGPHRWQDEFLRVWRSSSGC
jgi:hypothetical protein